METCVRKKFVLDMETGDPDDLVMLMWAASHPQIELVAVTIYPGTRDQVGLVHHVLTELGCNHVPIGSFNVDHKSKKGNGCVGHTYRRHYKFKPRDPDASGAELLRAHFAKDTTLVMGGPYKNLAEMLRQDEETGDTTRPLGRLFLQGGFAGEGVVPREDQLAKFRGLTYCPSFNPGRASPESLVLKILNNVKRFEDLRFVSKNVCHGVTYDRDIKIRMRNLSKVKDSRARYFELFQTLFAKYKNGKKALHDPFAACCALEPGIARWAHVDIIYQKGKWGAKLNPNSPVQIVTKALDRSRFVALLIPGDASQPEKQTTDVPPSKRPKYSAPEAEKKSDPIMDLLNFPK